MLANKNPDRKYLVSLKAHSNTKTRLEPTFGGLIFETWRPKSKVGYESWKRDNVETREQDEPGGRDV